MYTNSSEELYECVRYFSGEFKHKLQKMQNKDSEITCNVTQCTTPFSATADQKVMEYYVEDRKLKIIREKLQKAIKNLKIYKATEGDMTTFEV